MDKGKTNRPAYCQCGEQMNPSVACECVYLAVATGNGGEQTVERLRKDNPGLCPDCNVADGQYHHIHCQHEQCPVCGGQLISCNCTIGYYVLEP